MKKRNEITGRTNKRTPQNNQDNHTTQAYREEAEKDTTKMTSTNKQKDHIGKIAPVIKQPKLEHNDKSRTRCNTHITKKKQKSR